MTPLFDSQSLFIPFIAEYLTDTEVKELCRKYFDEEINCVGKNGRTENARKLISFCQERSLLFKLMIELALLKQNEFLQFLEDTRDLSIDYRYGDLSLINPVRGAVLLDYAAFHVSLQVLRGHRYKVGSKERIRALACLMQLIEAIVLHEQIYVLGSPFSPGSLNVEGSGLEKARYLLRVLPFSYEVESELMKLPLKSERQGILIHPADSAYSLLSAAKVGLPYRPDPETGMYTQWRVTEPTDDYYKSFADQVLENVKNIASSETDQMNRLLSESRFSIETPMIFNYVLDENQSKAETIIDTALRSRESKEAKSFRRFCGEFDLAARIGDDQTLYRLKAEIDKACEGLKTKCQQPTLEFDIEFPLSISLNPVELWRYVQHKRKRHLVFIDRLYQAALHSKSIYHQLLRTLR